MQYSLELLPVGNHKFSDFVHGFDVLAVDMNDRVLETEHHVRAIAGGARIRKISCVPNLVVLNQVDSAAD